MLNQPKSLTRLGFSNLPCEGGTNVRDDASRRERATAEDLSEASIRKELRSLALQHPATLIPFAIAALCVFFLLIGIIPSVLAIIVLIVAVLVAVGSFVWIYSIRHDNEYAKLVQQIMATQGRESREVEEAELTDLRDTLKTGFSALESAPGLKALTNRDYRPFFYQCLLCIFITKIPKILSYHIYQISLS